MRSSSRTRFVAAYHETDAIDNAIDASIDVDIDVSECCAIDDSERDDDVCAATNRTTSSSLEFRYDRYYDLCFFRRENFAMHRYAAVIVTSSDGDATPPASSSPIASHSRQHSDGEEVRTMMRLF